MFSSTTIDRTATNFIHAVESRVSGSFPGFDLLKSKEELRTMRLHVTNDMFFAVSVGDLIKDSVKEGYNQHDLLMVGVKLVNGLNTYLLSEGCDDSKPIYGFDKKKARIIIEPADDIVLKAISTVSLCEDFANFISPNPSIVDGSIPSYDFKSYPETEAMVDVDVDRNYLTDVFKRLTVVSFVDYFSGKHPEVEPLKSLQVTPRVLLADVTGNETDLTKKSLFPYNAKLTLADCYECDIMSVTIPKSTETLPLWKTIHEMKAELSLFAFENDEGKDTVYQNRSLVQLLRNMDDVTDYGMALFRFDPTYSKKRTWNSTAAVSLCVLMNDYLDVLRDCHLAVTLKPLVDFIRDFTKVLRRFMKTVHKKFDHSLDQMLTYLLILKARELMNNAFWILGIRA